MSFAKRAHRRRGGACAAGVAACSYDFTSVVPVGPSLIPRRGSAAVTLVSNDLHMRMHHTSALERIPGDSLVAQKVVVTGFHDLDVRTCERSWRWHRPAGPEPDGGDIPVAERGMFGPVGFYGSDDRSRLMATNAASAQTWAAAVGVRPVEDFPFAQRGRVPFPRVATRLKNGNYRNPRSMEL